MATAMTRSNTKVWLIGQPIITALTENKLPSVGEVLRRLAHCQKENTLGEAARNVIAEVEIFWAKARIPTMTSKSAVRKLRALHDEWRNLQRSRKRRGPTPEAARTAFAQGLHDLFDAAHGDALSIIPIQEDREFLLAQREKGRRGTMTGVDMTLTETEQRSSQREANYERRRQDETRRAEEAREMAALSSGSSPAASPNGSEDEDDDVFAALPKRSRSSMMTGELASALDRTSTTNRGASHILQAVAASLGGDGNELSPTPSRETIRRKRMRYRAEIAKDIKTNFDPSVPLVAHWDGKIMTDANGEKVDRLAIIVSGDGVEKLLAVPSLPAGTGRAQADAVLDSLADWGIADRVVGLSFDTTSSNTGVITGAWVFIEQGLHRQLLNLACRHHMLELVAEKAFTVCVGPSSGPDIPLFARLKGRWQFICTDQYCQISEEDLSKPLLEARDELITRFQRHLSMVQPRDDYRELLELAIVALGGVPHRGVRFMRPGALHRARWMARVLYTIKLHLFRQQLDITAHEARRILRFVNFALLVYIPAWFTAPVAAAAPRIDLATLKVLADYMKVDKEVAKATSTVFRRHLWYLSEHLVTLAFFDDDTPLEVKQKMVTAIEEVEGTEEPAKRIAIPADISPAELEQKTVADFVTASSKLLFERLAIDTSFLELAPASWPDNAAFMAGKRRVSALGVVNDRAERGVALMQRYNLALTKNEDQRQYLMQVVEKHRKEHPGPVSAASH